MIHAAMLAVRAAKNFEKSAELPAGEAAAYFMGGALAGLGVKSYIDGNRRRDALRESLNQAEHAANVRQYTNQLERETQALLSKQSALMTRVQDAGNPAAPAAPAKVSMPSTPSGLSITQKSGPAGAGAIKAPSASMGGAPSAPGTKSASDAATPTLVAAGLGGLGGWAVGDKLIAPALQARRAKLLEEIARKQRTAGQLATGSKWAPVGAAAAGALLLAALVATMRNRDASGGSYPQPMYQDYDPTGAGFAPGEQSEYNTGVY